LSSPWGMEPGESNLRLVQSATVEFRAIVLEELALFVFPMVRLFVEISIRPFRILSVTAQ
jgi:hypothetical protein